VYPNGTPSIITFVGFGTESGDIVYLPPNGWASGIIEFANRNDYHAAFVLPTNAILKHINVTISTQESDVVFEASGTARPFACIAISTGPGTLEYTILKETLTFTPPIIGGMFYPSSTIRKGESRELNIPLARGTRVAFAVGIIGENVMEEGEMGMAASGGLFFEWT